MQWEYCELVQLTAITPLDIPAGTNLDDYDVMQAALWALHAQSLPKELGDYTVFASHEMGHVVTILRWRMDYATKATAEAPGALADVIARLGNEGWEMVAALEHNDPPKGVKERYIFKRPIV